MGGPAFSLWCGQRGVDMNPTNTTQHRVPNTAPPAPTATPTVVVVDSGVTLSACCGAYTSCDQYGEEYCKACFGNPRP